MKPPPGGTDVIAWIRRADPSPCEDTMAQPEKRENSVLFSLRELRTIEESRVKEEESAAVEVEQARIRARLEAERRVKEEEDAKVRAAEEAARHEREMTEMRLREEQMRIQETEARARAEHQAQLEASRLQHEMEIRRVEASKKRPTWLVITVGVAVVAAAIAIFVTVQKINAKDKADQDRRAAQAEKEKAEEAKKAAEKAQRDLEVEVEGFRVTLAGLTKQMDDANRDLLAANSQADRDKAAARQAEIRRQQAAVQAEIDRRRAKVKPKCPPDQPLC
ncbi:MAG: hypothetical protein IPL61_10000 [Myxococcales bacterium]|nr:hypothetical protein [Myxococcales bacterium]